MSRLTRGCSWTGVENETWSQVELASSPMEVRAVSLVGFGQRSRYRLGLLDGPNTETPLLLLRLLWQKL